MNVTPRYRFGATSVGATADWALVGTADPVAAILRGSGDTTYIASNVPAQISVYDCGDGYHPHLGIVAAVTLHYRYRTTDTAGAPALDLLFTQGALTTTVGTLNPATTNWTSGELRLRFDPTSGVRFTRADLPDLGLGVEVNTAPAAGRFEVSELWLEVEHIVSPEFYDPAGAALPDAVAGQYMRWVLGGTQPSALAGNYLQLNDGSAVDHVAYRRFVPEVNTRFFSVVDTRLFFQSYPGAGTQFFYGISGYDDATRSIRLAAFVDGGVSYIGLISEGRDFDDPSAYLAAAPFDFSGTVDHHFRLWVERESGPLVYGKVRVYADYAETPLLEASYVDFDATLNSTLWFGTGTPAYQSGTVDARVDYISWWTSRHDGEAFADWFDSEAGTNRVRIETADPFIVRPMPIPPTDVVTGQSEYCCRLEVADTTKMVGTRQYWGVLNGAAQYDLSFDYRMDLLGTTAVIAVQRISDYFYWDDIGKAWQSAAASVTLPNSMLRTRAAAMTDIQTAVPDRLMFRILNAPGAPGAHSIYLYKVDLRV